jgi:hypothetical protein
MEDRLKRLKKTMDETVFNEWRFSEEQQTEIRKKMTQQHENEEDVLLSILQLLVQRKTGYELTQQIRRRGIRKFEDNEGFLYTLLHRLEQTGYLQSSWDEQSVKYYELDDKGRKALKKAEKSRSKKSFRFKELLEG